MSPIAAGLVNMELNLALETSARRDGGEWVIDRQDKGFLVEKGTPGYDARPIDGKGSLRAVWQAEITLSGVRVPEENRPPGATSFKDAGRVLAGKRNAVAWGAVGHATAACEAAVAYCR
jgi:glutaryl-CoA dehydrogenase